MTCKHKSYDPADQEARSRIIASAIGSQRAEGLDLDEESLADLGEFVSGTISMGEVRARAEARYGVDQPSSSLEP
jgi:hypothetical protein